MPLLLEPLDLRGHAAGTRPPAFSGGSLDLRLLRGRVILLKIWASWCAECRRETPVLERLHRALGPRGLAVVGINAREEATSVRRYATALIEALLAEPAPRPEAR